jgi:hypothetical protein
MDGQEPIDSFDLDDDVVVYDEVEPVAAIERDPFVTQRHGPLPFDPASAKPKLVGHAKLVRGFEQARAEVTVHLDARANDNV